MSRTTRFLKLFLPEDNDYYRVEEDQNENFEKIDKKLEELHARCPYRVGDIYTTTNSSNPALLWVGTTWKKIEGKFLRASSSGEESETTGGSDTKVLSISNLPAHKHSASAENAGWHTHTQSSHSHGRGDMNIWGKFGDITSEAGYDGEGAFRKASYKTSGRAAGSGAGKLEFDFNANRDWTGNTSAASPDIKGNGSHTHPIAVSSAGEGRAFDIKPAYIIVHIWKRVS